METKKVTLNNGTVLEVGNTFEFDKCERGNYFTMLFIGDYKMAYKYNNSGDEVAMSIDKNLMIIPYTPPTPQKEWKTFLIEVEEYNANSVWSPARRAIVQMYSIEYAKRLYPKAKITEVRINIEQVK